MRKFEGLGLAAIQIGVPKRLFVYDDSEKQDNPRVLINPVITAISDERALIDEGCLSFPGLYRPVERSAKVTITGLDHEGQPVEVTADGLLARVIQHEIDHLDGINFVAHLSDKERKAALREFFDLAVPNPEN
jgi:peptide deformylase